MGSKPTAPPIVCVVLLLVFAAGAGRVPETRRTRIEPDASTFFILGALVEYRGRTIVETGDLVEKFGCNETEARQAFESALDVFLLRQGLETANVVREVEQQCITSLRSRVAADAINSLYRYEFISGRQSVGPDGLYHRTADLFISASMLEPFGDEAKLAFLAGAYLRFGENNTFRFANAEHKAGLVAALLGELGCDHIDLKSSEGTIPKVTVVSFEPTEQVDTWLHGYRPSL